MKKNIVIIFTFTIVMIMAMTLAVFADSIDETPIRTAEHLKNVIDIDLLDGDFSKAEKQNILKLTDEEAINELIAEKLDVAIDVINQQEISIKVTEELVRYTYDLGDNCELVVDLQDKLEFNSLEQGLMMMAASRSNELWKEYGNRYFTAVASVKCNIATASFRLENHYTLSSEGIDERPGKAFATWTLGDGMLGAETPVITDGSARTVGTSDVNMHCIFSCKSGSAGPDKYKINTTVKYISHDKSGKRIKVGHAWNLTKI